MPSRLIEQTLASVAVLSLGFILAGCGGSPPPPSPATVFVPSAPATSPAQPPAPAVTTRTDQLAVRFVQVTEQGFPELEMTNLTDQDIETLRGSFGATNAEGVQVWGTGLTIAVPGQVFLAAGANRITTPFGLDRKPEMMEILRTDPASLSFFFAAQEIGFRGE